MATAIGRSVNRAAPWRHVDMGLLVPVVAIASLSVLMVYSATQKRLDLAEVDPQLFMKRQVLYVTVGFMAMIAVTLIDYRVFRDFGMLMFAGTVGLLVVVLSPLGSTSRGIQAWFQIGAYQFQPSEIAKLALVVALATYLADLRGEVSVPHIGRVLAIASVPLALIYLQPDVGTALVLVAIVMGLLLVAGVRARHLVVLVLLGMVAIVGVVRLGVLKDYQLDRLAAFLDSERDPQRSSYNLNQSKIAIGSGGLTGKGLFRGTQTNLAYVPEQHSDFIFTVVGEELGLLGSAAVLMLFAVVIWRMWRAAALAKDLCGTLMCVGVLAMMMFQIFQNIGMSMGIMPVTGIPLPLMSYGGSSVLTAFAGVGLVLNVHMRRFS